MSLFCPLVPCAHAPSSATAATEGLHLMLFARAMEGDTVPVATI